MSLIPSFFGGRRSNVFDPFSLDVWDPFKDFPLSNSSFPKLSEENSAIVNARVDWKETPEARVQSRCSGAEEGRGEGGGRR
ncbi:hypothetical protein F8388_002193 [Cannabis sativa]|uniref:Uncharacterized protein n=1 Tax=Cannabis sativa TaxID=3483 RepID=A0A7J6FUC1_CANSA|nr:hypothetical protein F8388_002193 [Cannabis sativa]